MVLPSVQQQPLKSEGYRAWIYAHHLRESFEVCHQDNTHHILTDDRCQLYPSKRQILQVLQQHYELPPVLSFTFEQHILFYIATQAGKHVQYHLRDTLEFSEHFKVLN